MILAFVLLLTTARGGQKRIARLLEGFLLVVFDAE